MTCLRLQSQCRKLLSVYLCASTTACSAAWRTVRTPWPGTIPPKQQVQVWSGSHVARLHGVQWTPDSLTGVPYRQPLDCDSCRVSLARTDVDSLRFGTSGARGWTGAILVLFGLLVGVAVLCASARGGCEHADWTLL